MLKLVGTVRNGSRLAPRSSSWCISSHQTISACSSTATANKAQVETLEVTDRKASKISRQSKNSLVESAFSALGTDYENTNDNNKGLSNNLLQSVFGKIETDNQSRSKRNKTPFNKTKAMENILKNNEFTFVSADTANKVVTALNQLVEDGKLRYADFENDRRYQKLCNILLANVNRNLKTLKQNKNDSPISSSLIFGLSDLNESFADVKDLSLPQTIKVLSGLAMRQKRIKPLLEGIAQNIVNTKTELGIKNIADILYSFSRLNYRNTPLLEKLTTDLQKLVPSMDQSPIFGSILTSLGMIKYRNDNLIQLLCEWAMKNKAIIRTQDLSALLMTLATVGYSPEKMTTFYEDLVGNLKEVDMVKSSEWVDVVWSLTVLNKVTPEQISSVLNEKFILNLSDSENIFMAKKHKLLNINAAAKLLMKNYDGPVLKPESPVFDAPLVNIKDKQVFVKSITDALANLFPSRDHFQTNVDDGTGFLLDAKFYLDKKSAPLPIEKINEKTKATKIAVLAYHYHDYCLGTNSLLGSVLFHYKLLEADGYKILDISHLDFHSDDKLLKRISYINKRIKTLVSSVK